MKSQQFLVVFATFLLSGFLGAQAQSSIKRVEPPNWWVGMKNSSLQLLVYGENITDWYPSIDYQGVSVERVTRVPNDLAALEALIRERRSR